MKKINLSLISVLVLTLSGCGSVSTNFTKTGDMTFEPLEKGCPISIYTTKPTKEFDEVGIVDFNISSGPFLPNMTSAGKVKDRAADYVCEAGGNGIFLWEATSRGTYIKATVVKTR